MITKRLNLITNIRRLIIHQPQGPNFSKVLESLEENFSDNYMENRNNKPCLLVIEM